MQTANKARIYYNRWTDYETSLDKVGWQTPCLLVSGIKSCLRGGEKILDVGCGTGDVGTELISIGWNGTLIGVDIAEERLREAREKFIYSGCVHGDAYHLPFSDRSFDIVLSNAMVGLTGVRSLREMHRLTKSGGFLVCTVGELKDRSWSQKRFQGALSWFSLVSGELVAQVDLGTGYVDSYCNHERYHLFIVRVI